MAASRIRSSWSRLRGPRLAVGLLVAVAMGGTAGYVLIEGWTPWEGVAIFRSWVAAPGRCSVLLGGLPWRDGIPVHSAWLRGLSCGIGGLAVSGSASREKARRAPPSA